MAEEELNGMRVAILCTDPAFNKEMTEVFAQHLARNRKAA